MNTVYVVLETTKGMEALTEYAAYRKQSDAEYAASELRRIFPGRAFEVMPLVVM